MNEKNQPISAIFYEIRFLFALHDEKSQLKDFFCESMRFETILSKSCIVLSKLRVKQNYVMAYFCLFSCCLQFFPNSYIFYINNSEWNVDRM